MLARLPAVAADPTAKRALAAVADLPRAVLLAAAPVGVAAAVAAVAAMAAQGVHLTTKTLKFKASRLSPKHGLKRMLGPRALWEAAKALVKVLVIAAVVVVLGRSLVPELVGRGTRPLGEAIATLAAGLRSLVWVAAAAGLLMAAADYGYQRRTRDEAAAHDPAGDQGRGPADRGRPDGQAGHPEPAGRDEPQPHAGGGLDRGRRAGQPHALRGRSALRVGQGRARVVAKGADALAAKIRERAREHGVPIVEDKPLTRLLYRVCELEDEIPAELYVAVARILAFVLALRRPGGGPVSAAGSGRAARAAVEDRPAGPPVPGAAGEPPRLPRRWSALIGRAPRRRRGDFSPRASLCSRSCPVGSALCAPDVRFSPRESTGADVKCAGGSKADDACDRKVSPRE